VYGLGVLNIDRTAPVVQARPVGGSYASPIYVHLRANEDARIYYTLDGTTPTAQSLRYRSPLLVNQDLTLQFMGVDPAGNQSAIHSEDYSIGARELTCTVKTGDGVPLAGLRVYGFTEGGSYTGIHATTDEHGKAVFDPEAFSDGNYRFRIDYLGHRFWSETFALPATRSVNVTIDQSPVNVSVSTSTGPSGGVKVYLFSPSGSYLGRYGVTDENGVVVFDLPVDCSFKFRADILGSRYFSDTFTVSGTAPNNVGVDAGGGRLLVTVQEEASHPMEGVKVYLFNPFGSYLGRKGITDSSGRVFRRIRGHVQATGRLPGIPVLE